MKINELSESQRERLKKALETDGFSNVQVNENYISFSKFPRDFEMYGLSINLDYNNLDDDNGVNIIFKEKEFFEPKKSYKDSSKFLFSEQLKTRHSTSIEQKTLNSDIEDAVESIPGWRLVKTYDLKDLNEFYTESESSVMAHILIKGKDHIALNHGEGNSYIVYEGTPDLLLSILKENPENFLLTPTFVKEVSEIKLEMNDY